MAKRGRKSGYETKVKPYFSKIEEWCKTSTEQQIAERLGVGYSTWCRYKNEFGELREILEKGRRDLVADLRSSLIKRAHGYDYTESKVVEERMKIPKDMMQGLLDMGYTMEQLEGVKVVRTEVQHKKMAPDVAALNLALKNYDRDSWANDPQMLRIREKELELREKQIEKDEW